MAAMKERKQVEIDEVMETKHRPSIDDLMRLFGRVEHDENGKPFIFPDTTSPYDDDDGPGQRFVEHDSDDEQGHMGNEE
jgi:hypothetical protein